MLFPWLKAGDEVAAAIWGVFLCLNVPSFEGTQYEIETEGDRRAIFDEGAKVVIRGMSDGPAERFASKFGFEFKAIEP